jgi:hypothetical protein
MLSSPSGGSKPGSPADVLMPDGRPVGEVRGSASPDIRTVAPGQLDGIIEGLKGLGAKPESKSNYPGDWYQLPDDKGGFGIRNSRNSGRTLDLDIPGVPDISKIHQK